MNALSGLKATHQSCDADSKSVISSKPKMPKYGGGSELNVMVAGVIRAPAQIQSSLGSNPTGNSSTGVAKFLKPATKTVSPDVENKDENAIQVDKGADAAMTNTADSTPRKTTKLSIPAAFQMDTQPDKPTLLVKPHINVQPAPNNGSNNNPNVDRQKMPAKKLISKNTDKNISDTELKSKAGIKLPLSLDINRSQETANGVSKLRVTQGGNVNKIVSLGNSNNVDHKPVQKPESPKHSDNMLSDKPASFDLSRKSLPCPIKAPTDNFITQRKTLEPVQPNSSQAVIRYSDGMRFLKVNIADFNNCGKAPEKPSKLTEEIDFDLLIKEFKEAVLNTGIVLHQEDDYDDVENAKKNAEAEDTKPNEPYPGDDHDGPPHIGPKPPELPSIKPNKIQTKTADCVLPESSPTTPTTPTTPKEKPKDSKEADKERKRKMKEEKDKMKKKEKEIKILFEWYKIDSAVLAMSMAKGVVKKTAKSKNKKEVSVNEGDEVNIIRMVDCPIGKWLVQIVSSQNVGYCDDDNIEIAVDTVRIAMAISGSSSGLLDSTDTAASKPSDWSEEAYEDVDVNKNFKEEDKIYEDCS